MFKLDYPHVRTGKFGQPHYTPQPLLWFDLRTRFDPTAIPDYIAGISIFDTSVWLWVQKRREEETYVLAINNDATEEEIRETLLNILENLTEPTQQVMKALTDHVNTDEVFMICEAVKKKWCYSMEYALALIKSLTKTIFH